jgi:hypothetical protein
MTQPASLLVRLASCEPNHAADLLPWTADGLLGSCCRAAYSGLPMRLMSPWTGFTHRPSWYRRHQAGAAVVLTGRATSVPFAAVASGPERTPTVSATMAVTCTVCHLNQVAITLGLALQAGVSADCSDFRLASALSVLAPTPGGLLGMCWQQAPDGARGMLFVLVGVTGFEPVASAV